MKQKEFKMNMIMATVISLAMGVLVAILLPIVNPQSASQPVAIRYISNILMSLIVGIIVALVIPLGRLGRALAGRCGATPPTMKFNLLNAIPISLGNTIIVSLACSLMGVLMARKNMPPEALSQVPPFAVMWFGGWVKLLLPTLIVSYIIAVVLAPIVGRAVGLGGPPPGAGGPPHGAGGPPLKAA